MMFDKEIKKYVGRVKDLELSCRSVNALRGEDILYIGDLVQKSETELLGVPNFGIKSLNEIKEFLTDMGLSLGMNVPNWPPENIKEIEIYYKLLDWQRKSEHWQAKRDELLAGLSGKRLMEIAIFIAIAQEEKDE